jgi:hypothetical protein
VLPFYEHVFVRHKILLDEVFNCQYFKIAMWVNWNKDTLSIQANIEDFHACRAQMPSLTKQNATATVPAF